MILLTHLLMFVLLVFNNYVIGNSIPFLVVIMLSTIFITILKLFKTKNTRLILLGYILRLLVLYMDIYTKIPIINSGGDSEAFYRTSVQVSRDLSLLNYKIYGGIYTKINGLLIHLVGENRLIIQYTNIFLYLCISMIILNIFSNSKLKKEILNNYIAIWCFFPNVLILNSIFLRETWISFLLVIAYFYLDKWRSSGRNVYILLSISYVLIAALFHSAIILSIFSIIYIVQKNGNVKDRTLYNFINVVIALVFVFLIYEKGLLRHFNSLDFNDIYFASGNLGRSNYLTNVSITSFMDMIKFFPIKTLYFFMSPVPWEITSIMDLLVFLLDSFLYLLLFYRILKVNKSWMFFLIISYFPYIIAIFNVGTAIRHRAKFFPIIILIAASTHQKKKGVNI